MLKLLRLGAATIAAVLGTQVTSSLIETQANAANQSVQASTSNLVMTETSNAVTNITNANSILVADFSTNTSGAAEKVYPTEMLLGIAAVGGGAAGVVLSAREIKNHFKSRSPYSRSGFSNQQNTTSLDQASRKLQKELLRLLHDDRDTANRLLSQVKIKNPDRSVDWCVEKVIYDLERDRGSY